MDPDPIEIEDIGIFAALSVLLFLMVWVIRLLRNLDSTRVDKVCSGGPSVSLKKGQLTGLLGTDAVSSALATMIGSVPTDDLNINAKLKCDVDG
jgi:hypothetical protein